MKQYKGSIFYLSVHPLPFHPLASITTLTENGTLAMGRETRVENKYRNYLGNFSWFYEGKVHFKQYLLIQ